MMGRVVLKDDELVQVQLDGAVSLQQIRQQLQQEARLQFDWDRETMRAQLAATIDRYEKIVAGLQNQLSYGRAVAVTPDKNHNRDIASLKGSLKKALADVADKSNEAFRLKDQLRMAHEEAGNQGLLVRALQAIIDGQKKKCKS